MKNLFQISQPKGWVGQSAKSAVHGSVVAPILFALGLLFSSGMIYLIILIAAQTMTMKVSSAPAGWLMSLLVFQMVTVAAYIYAHLITRLPRIRHQIGFHVMLWLVSSSFLPLDIGDGWVFTPHTTPLTELLFEYISTIAAPLLFLTSNLLLIQSWYGRTKGPSAKDPYFLYGTAGFGGLIVLSAYPTLLEPLLGSGQLSEIWSNLFIFMGGFILLAAFWTTRSHPDARTVIPIKDEKSDIRVLFGWALLAFIPSALLHIYTRELSLVMGSYSAVWCIPIALYLLSYITGFQDKPLIADKIMTILYPATVSILAVSFIFQGGDQFPFIELIIKLVAFSVLCLHLHRRAFMQRPTTDRLTLFYSILALGAALGGVFSSIVAPILMDGYHEVALIFILATAIGFGTNEKDTFLNQGFLIALAFVTVGMSAISPDILAYVFTPELIIFAIAGSTVSMTIRVLRPIATILMCITAIAIIGKVDRDPTIIMQNRGFFGTHDVTLTSNRLKIEKNGRVIGAQDLAPELGLVPFQSKFHSSRKLHEIFISQDWRVGQIAVSGLGAGEVLSFAPFGLGQMHVFEPDPALYHTALLSGYFRYAGNERPSLTVQNADIRDHVTIGQDIGYNGIFIDTQAHSVLPFHLMTVEGVSELSGALNEESALIYFTEGSHYDLSGPLASAAHQLGLSAYGYRRDMRTGLPAEDFIDFTLIAITRESSKPTYLDDTWKRLKAEPYQALRDAAVNPLPFLIRSADR